MGCSVLLALSVREQPLAQFIYYHCHSDKNVLRPILLAYYLEIYSRELVSIGRLLVPFPKQDWLSVGKYLGNEK